MSRTRIKHLIERMTSGDGMTETAVKGVQLFRVTGPVPCVPAVYEPSVVAIASGTKEAILDGCRYAYDESRYMCCPTSLPVEAGTPAASPDNPLLGVYIALDPRVMGELALEIDNAPGGVRRSKTGPLSQGLALAAWDDAFTDALLRLLQVLETPTDASVLGLGRLRELYYAVLNGQAGDHARQAFGIGNDIARSIAYLSDRVDETITIEDLAAQVGMSRAVFHRKFKQATTMSPIQFVKSMRLNSAAMKIVGGMTVNEAAHDVGYVSTSQFSREFKRLYGLSPRQWSHNAQALASIA